MKILLLYNGYPRLSQTYQLDEGDYLYDNKHELLIFSWNWNLYTIKEKHQPFIYDNPVHHLQTIEAFQPDVIHVTFLNNIELAEQIALRCKTFFTIRTHSFDMLECNIQKYAKFVNKDTCKAILVFPMFIHKCIEAGFAAHKLVPSYPIIHIHRFIQPNIPNGPHIMSGGACLPKKNIPGFIALAATIKKLYPSIEVSFYTVAEDPTYFEKVKKLNEQYGCPVTWKTVQPDVMPLEYKKHQWLIYTACNKLKTVGYPLMVCEAQAAGVGVVMFNLRPDCKDIIVQDTGYVYDYDKEVLDIIKQPFDETKRQAAMTLSWRYDLIPQMKQLEQTWSSPTPLKRFLVFTSAGDHEYCQVSKWSLQQAPKLFDLAVCYYGDEDNKYQTQADIYLQRKGSKFQNFYFMWTNNLIPKTYDRYFIVDDDIMISVEQINQLFLVSEEYDVSISQPAFADNRLSAISHAITKQMPRSKLRFTNFVELNTMCFSKDALELCMNVYDDSLVGYGLDYLFLWSLHQRPEKHTFAIIDSISCINPVKEVREIDQLQSHQARKECWLKVRDKLGIVEWKHETYKQI